MARSSSGRSTEATQPQLPGLGRVVTTSRAQRTIRHLAANTAEAGGADLRDDPRPHSVLTGPSRGLKTNQPWFAAADSYALSWSGREDLNRRFPHAASLCRAGSPRLSLRRPRVPPRPAVDTFRRVSRGSRVGQELAARSRLVGVGRTWPPRPPGLVPLEVGAIWQAECGPGACIWLSENSSRPASPR